MKSRPTPDPINYRRPLPTALRHDPQVIKWAKRLRGNRRARPYDLDEQQLAWVHVEVMRRRGDLSQASMDLYLKALGETCPVAVAPELDRDHLADDLEVLFAQPEMRTFWERWQGRRGKSGPAPCYFTSKSLMTVMGMAGISAHADDAYAELTQGGALWPLFERLSGLQGKEPAGYQSALKQFPRLEAMQLAVETNIEMVKALARLMPGKGIGERLLIDGSGIPAWVKQVGKGKTQRQEAYRRRHCPEAGARAVMRNGRIKRGVRAGDTASAFMNMGDFWRGYYLVLIADQATGLPLVWTVQDAGMDEAQAIVPLLSDLYRHWPECPATLIAGDSAWDEDPWCRVCEADYGIHPIFRLHDDRGQQPIQGFSRDETIVARTHEGQLICADHREPLVFVGAETPSRDGLRPGQTNDERAFRVRAECSKGCGKTGLKMAADWSSVTYYPHYASGRVGARRNAYRKAMLTRLNGIEAIFERLKVGRKLGAKGGSRTRIRDKGAHEMLISLGLLSMTAATLADQRHQHGVSVPPIGSGSSPGGVGSLAAGSSSNGSAPAASGNGSASSGSNNGTIATASMESDVNGYCRTSPARSPSEGSRPRKRKRRRAGSRA